MNTALDILNTVLDAGIGALGAIARAMLANVATAEWVLAVALAGAAWMLSSGRGWRAVGVLVFLAVVSAGAWLSWRTHHHGMVAQQAALAAMVLHGLVKGRGWALLKGGRK